MACSRSKLVRPVAGASISSSASIGCHPVSGPKLNPATPVPSDHERGQNRVTRGHMVVTWLRMFRPYALIFKPVSHVSLGFFHVGNSVSGASVPDIPHFIGGEGGYFFCGVNISHCFSLWSPTPLPTPTRNSIAHQLIAARLAVARP